MERNFKDVVAIGSLVYKPPRTRVSHEEHQDESDDVQLHGTEVHNDADQGSSNTLQRKRKRGRQGDKRVGAAQEIQNSINRLIDSINKASVAPIPPRPVDPFSITKCVNLLNDVPGLVPRSPLWVVTLHIMKDKVNRETLVALMEACPDGIVPWLETFTIEEAKKLAR